MPYIIKKKGKKYQIVNKETGKVVGTSDSKAKAGRSIGYRMEAEMKKRGKKMTAPKMPMTSKMPKRMMPKMPMARVGKMKGIKKVM